LVVGGLLIAVLISLLIYMTITNNADKVIMPLCWFGPGGIIALLVTIMITAIFFQVPTGRYKYEATIDKDKITVAEYEQFIEEYNPTIKDGIYYWEDKAE
jgi:uncharacterized membrane protein (DUF106 family)